MQLGKYRYRSLMKLPSRGSWISPTRLLYSFGTIPFVNLCGAPNANLPNGCGGSSDGTVEVGGNVFAYVMAGNYDQCESGNWTCVDMQFPNTTCRLIDLRFALDDAASQSGEQANIRVTQQKGDPQYASTTQGTVGAARMRLYPGTFYLANNTTDGDLVYYNGTASCYSQNGE